MSNVIWKRSTDGVWLALVCRPSSVVTNLTTIANCIDPHESSAEESSSRE